MDSDKLTFIHLSDIHFIKGFSGESAFDIDEKVRSAILDDARCLRPHLGAVQGILITGDTAFGGKSSEYQTAFEWLGQLADILECDKGFVWCVPGNHDIDQSVLKDNTAISAVHDRVRASSNPDKQLKDDLSNENAGFLLFTALKSYNENFADRLDCPTTPKQPWWTEDLPLNDGCILRLRGLNSVIISGLKDDVKEKKLFLGAPQTEYGREQGVEYLTLCHHPKDWLLDGDEREEALLAYSKIQLFGHKHKFKANEIDGTLWIAAGAVHPVREEKDWIPRYNYLSIFVEGAGTERHLIVELYARIWNQPEREFCREMGNYDGEFRQYRLKLRDWTPPSSVSKPNSPQENSSNGSNPDSSVEGGKVTLSRKKLLFRFMGLPFHARIALMKKFGLWDEDDKTRPDSQVFADCFERARNKGVLDQLWDAIESQEGQQL